MFVLTLPFTLHEGGGLRFLSSLYSLFARSLIGFCDWFLYHFVTRFLQGGVRLHQEKTKGISLKIKPSQHDGHSVKRWQLYFGLALGLRPFLRASDLGENQQFNIQLQQQHGYHDHLTDHCRKLRLWHFFVINHQMLKISRNLQVWLWHDGQHCWLVVCLASLSGESPILLTWLYSLVFSLLYYSTAVPIRFLTFWSIAKLPM